MAEKNVHATSLSDTIPVLNVPESIAENMDLFLRLVRTVLEEFDPTLLETFDVLLSDAFRANADEAAETPDERAAFAELERTIDGLDERRATLLMRAFVAYFHLANICEEHYRVTSLREREGSVDPAADADPINDLTVAYRRLVDECGRGKAAALLQRLEFRPVFTAHPTEARRKAVEGKIRRISKLLEERGRLAGTALAENERRLLQEIDALLRTSPIAHKKPTPVEEADTVIDIFDNTLFDMVPDVYRRFDDWELGDRAGTVAPVCPAFFHPGSWIGSDRDGNAYVTARVSRAVAEKFRVHVLERLADATQACGRNLTLDAVSTPPSDALVNLWSHQVEMSEELTARALDVSASELSRRASCTAPRCSSSPSACAPPSHAPPTSCTAARTTTWQTCASCRRPWRARVRFARPMGPCSASSGGRRPLASTSSRWSFASTRSFTPARSRTSASTGAGGSAASSSP